ncbi:MAG: hypothetical protein M1812_006971 [Candelaria pacifica]|nr:MAG: hypothetical protein M1812_006971 [Candelaria pacifica]
MERSPILVVDDDEVEIVPSSRAAAIKNTSQSLTPSSSKQRVGATGGTKDSISDRPHHSRAASSSSKQHTRRSGSGSSRDSSDPQFNVSSSKPRTRSARADSSPDISITHVRSKQSGNHGAPPSIRSSRIGIRREQPGSSGVNSKFKGAENIINLIEDDAEVIIKRSDLNPRPTPLDKAPLPIGQALTASKEGSIQHGPPATFRKLEASGRPPTPNWNRVPIAPQYGTQRTVPDDEGGVSPRVPRASSLTSLHKEQAPSAPGKEISLGSLVSSEGAMKSNNPKPAEKIPAGSVPNPALRKAPAQAVTVIPEPTAAKTTLRHPQSESFEGHDPMDINSKDRQQQLISEPVELTVAAMERVFQRHIKELQDDHRYLMRPGLYRARKACNENKTSDSLSARASKGNVTHNLSRQPSKFVQKSSPFTNMRGIELSNPIKGTEPAISCAKLSQTKTPCGKPETRNFSVPVTAYNSNAVTIPSYTSYITLSRNVLAENDKDMKYFPYFGDEVIVEKGALFKELEQTFNNRVQDLPLCRLRAEQADVFRPYAVAALEELGCSMSDILRYLLEDDRPLPTIKMSIQARNTWLDRALHLNEDFNREEKSMKKVLNDLPPRAERAVAVAGLACRAFLNITQFSLWHIAKADKGVFASGLPGKLSQGTMGSTNEAHAGANPSAQPLGTYSELGCLICHAHDCPGHGEYEEPNEDSDLEEQLGGNRRVRVATAAPTDDLALRKTVNCNASRDGPSVFDFLGKNSDGTITGVVPKDQNHKSEPANLNSQECSTECFWKKSNRVETVPQWSQDRLDLFGALLPAWVNSRNGPCIIAFAVEKPCAEVFTMIRSSQLAKVRESQPVIVIWGLARPRNAHVSNKGFSARKPVLALGDASDVFRDVTVPRQLKHVGKTKSVIVSRSTRGVPKRTLLGHSEIQGWGLYMGEAVTGGEFLGEYKGEVLSNAEAVRRGAIYAQRETCYLFTLNAEQVIDSTRAGNKFRFINDSEKHINCKSRVMLCNSVQRIGLYAERNIELGEELFFSYGYPQEVTKHFWDRDGPRAQVVGPPSRKGKTMTAKKVGSGKRGGARRGAGRKSQATKTAPMELHPTKGEKSIRPQGKAVQESDNGKDDEDGMTSIADSGDQDVYDMGFDSSEAEETPYEDESPHRRISRKSKRRHY